MAESIIAVVGASSKTLAVYLVGGSIEDAGNRNVDAHTEIRRYGTVGNRLSLIGLAVSSLLAANQRMLM